MEFFELAFGVIVAAGVGFWAYRRTRGVPEVKVAAAAVAQAETHGEPAQAPQAPEEAQETTVQKALMNTRQNLWGRILQIWNPEEQEKNLEHLEEILYTADLGPRTVQSLLQKMQQDLNRSELGDLQTMQEWLRVSFLADFAQAGVHEPGPGLFSHLHTEGQPSVWLVVGVNGAGKTTSIGKLALALALSGKKVLVAAGDTFRAAAASQLTEWSERARQGSEGRGGVEIFSPEGISDPSAVAYSALEKAKSGGFDAVLIDTAGRLHNQLGLMAELEKVKKVMGRVIPGAPHETLLVLDGSSGQNALIQAQEFHKALAVTGVILTKMDGTAKGGVAVGLAHEFGLPIRFIGIGEKAIDLKAFSAQEFVHAILPQNELRS
jgi:fused signal recognition particle receptor